MSATLSLTTDGRLVGLRRLSCRVMVIVLERGRGTAATEPGCSGSPTYGRISERQGYRTAGSCQAGIPGLAVRCLTLRTLGASGRQKAGSKHEFVGPPGRIEHVAERPVHAKAGLVDGGPSGAEDADAFC